MKIIFLFLLLGSFFPAFSQMGTGEFAVWKVLEDITYSKSEDEYGEIYVPEFGERIQKLEGKQISLPGYVIPFQGMFEPDHLILSSLPIASCFFCGGGGAETVAEVYLKDPIEYTAKLVIVTGTLELNDSDIDQLMYILKDAKLYIQ